jgi:hypothetical protein
MELIFVLVFLFFLLVTMTVIGHVVWIAIAAVLRWMFSDDAKSPPPPHTTRIFEAPPVPRPVDDLAAFERQLLRFYRDGEISEEVYEQLLARVRAERAPKAATDDTDKAKRAEPVVEREVVVEREKVPSVSSVVPERKVEPPPRRVEPPPAPPAPPPPPPPLRRPFSEVLNSFMEQSNIRWGEIIGGLLIIGCSTALVVSLWAQISEIPVLKFLIFTTVTAILFGIGLYTEHRWKLPTTSRGILTIATLLVPLNFLAIAAVSASNTSGALVIGSELLAPAIFLCLVYFAGRVITPGCAQILSAGVLGSSIGQLLVRHFADSNTSPTLLILLAAFPVTCYVVTVAFALRLVLADREIDESETTTVFTILGAMSFAALLPFGLLLYKSGALGLTMMYLAPIVTLWGLPLLATGTVLWRRIKNKELVASRTTGTALGILGLFIVLAGMFLAWPNPASIVPAALLNFAIFTMLAIALELPVAHLIGALCLALAYLVAFHVSAGRVPWENLRVISLLDVMLSLSSGQALAGAFVIFLIGSEWLSRKRRARESYYYLVAACAIAIVSLTFAAFFGFATPENHWLWIVFLIYSLGACWIAWRQRTSLFTWIASGLLLVALGDLFSRSLSISFPWQSALLLHATICAALAIASKRELLSKPFNDAALITIVFGVIALFQANTWEETPTQAGRVFWIALILLLLLWRNRRQIIFHAFQIALLCAVVLTVKAALQQFEWYAYLPHAFLHPSALQIYGTVLTLLCLAWLALRMVVKRASPQNDATADWLDDAWRLLDTNYSIDRILSWLLLGAFALFAVYGSLSGVVRELAVLGSAYPGINVANFPHQEALGLGSWILLGLLTVLLLANYRERKQQEYLLGAVVAFSLAIPLIAGRFELQMATVAALRWLAAVLLLGGSIVLWYHRNQTRELRALLLVLTLAPLLLLTAAPVWRVLNALPIQAPVAGIFSWLSVDVLYGGPLVLAALVMVGYALRERMPSYSVYGALWINLAVTVLFLLAAEGGRIDRGVVERLAQLNTLAFALVAVPWLGTRRLWLAKLDQQRQKLAGDLLELQVGLAIGFSALWIVPAAFDLIVKPEHVDVVVIVAGNLLGWIAVTATLVATVWLAKTRDRLFSAPLLAGALLAFNFLIAFSVADSNGLLALHVLTLCMTLAAWIMLVAGQRYAVWQARCRQFAAGIGAFAVLLSLWTATDADATRWWSVGPLLALSALAATLNWLTFRRRYLYAAGLLITLAVSIWCITIVSPAFGANGFFALNIIAGCLAGIGLLWLELRARQRRGNESPGGTVLSFHHLAAIGWPLLLASLVAISFVLQKSESPLWDMPWLYWLALVATIALMIAVLWDQHAKYAVAGLYLLGLLAVAMALYQLDLANMQLGWATVVSLAIYALGAAAVWRWRERFIIFAGGFGVPRRLQPDATELPWFFGLTVFTSIILFLLAYWIDLRSLSFGLRSTAALAVVVQFATFALIAEGILRRDWQRFAIAMLVVGLTLFGWSWLTPGLSGTWLNRSVILMLLVFGLTTVYGLLLEQVRAYSADWTNAAKSCVPVLLGAGVIALFFCLGTEVSYQLNYGVVRIHPLALTAIGATLVAAVFIPILFALSPKHDPLSLSERGRMNYVYAAEVMLALLFLHVRLTLPWLFTGFIERYWPLAVMAIAYLGVVTSESLRRRKLLVLAQPLERTGVFLPLLPVLGFWLASSDVDFSLLLFVVGGLYGLLSILRRSFGFGLLAAIAGNGGLWYILHRTDDYQFLQHPQLWLIPIALSVLLAAYLNEKHLSEDQMASIRYLSLVTIYVSSTADIFINGVANSPWLPLVLGSFSLAGVFAGIIFRIRGLLLLGSVFLLLSIVTMIWYASANLGWTWLWYVAGIVTGATIIFMFAVFEKKRSEVLRLVEGLKEWEK